MPVYSMYTHRHTHHLPQQMQRMRLLGLGAMAVMRENVLLCRPAFSHALASGCPSNLKRIRYIWQQQHPIISLELDYAGVFKQKQQNTTVFNTHTQAS